METPLHEYREDFRVRAAEAGMRNRLTVAAFCGYLQEAAGNHARELGLGIQELRAEGLTWMLARLQIAFSRPVGYCLAAGVFASALAVVIMRAYQACFTAMSGKASLFGKVK